MRQSNTYMIPEGKCSPKKGHGQKAALAATEEANGIKQVHFNSLYSMCNVLIYYACAPIVLVTSVCHTFPLYIRNSQ